MGVLEIFDWSPVDIWWFCWRYLIGVLQIFDGFPGNIWWVP